MLSWQRIAKHYVGVGDSVISTDGPCCICGSAWPDSQPLRDFTGFVLTSAVDVGACPRCHNSGRARMLWYMESKKCFDFKHKSILFFSPDTGYETSLCDRLRINNFLRTSDIVDRRDRDLVLDATALDLEDTSVDVIFFMHILEHIEDDTKCLRELNRILKPNGVLVIAVPLGPQYNTFQDPGITTPEQRLRYYYWHEHLRLYGTGFADTYLASGFDVRTYDVNTDHDFSANQRIINNEAVHYCRKVMK